MSCVLRDAGPSPPSLLSRWARKGGCTSGAQVCVTGNPSLLRGTYLRPESLDEPEVGLYHPLPTVDAISPGSPPSPMVTHIPPRPHAPRCHAVPVSLPIFLVVTLRKCHSHSMVLDGDSVACLPLRPQLPPSTPCRPPGHGQKVSPVACVDTSWTPDPRAPRLASPTPPGSPRLSPASSDSLSPDVGFFWLLLGASSLSSFDSLAFVLFLL